ncbi:hypothetical protein GW17_00055664 [Ensete ventricosum]|nr:hypothetical protein GW17_00055664 [Ensete ventricosum]
MLSTWAAAPAVGAVALGQHLAGGRCHLVWALPLQERSPLQAVALAVGLPLAAWPWALPMLVGVAIAGASHARGRLRMLAAAPARGFGRGWLPPCRGPWLQSAAPCSQPGRGWPALHVSWPWVATPPPRCLRCENVARTRRTILRDSISSHVV